MAVCALFLAFFMLKAIFSVRNAKFDGMLEVLPDEQPRLFAFLYELADAAGAPRPHKVFLSERVNAAVFYDLSLFNLIFPSKKNLEIGLALVNVLSLGELRAVLAHEFGHFAQRSMAVGRWVYIAQQITGHLVSRRDAIDDFLAGLARIDIRIRAGVAVIQLIIWSIRSLVESAFRVVVAMQHALSREMEMQADLVAVSLTGSDALVHALHRLQSADDAWDRAAQFAFGEKAEGKPTRDVFAVQTHVLQRMGDILDDAQYGQVPAVPLEQPEQHRIFKAELAQPPRMWLSHPLNHEREANAKRIYVAAPIDQTSAWALFDQPLQLREQMSVRLLGESGQEPPALEESLRKLGKLYRREHFKQRYCGAYFGRTLTRHVRSAEQLRDPARPAPVEELAQLYPDTLKELVRRRRMLDGEAAQLDALIAGTMTAQDGVVRLRGEEFRLPQLPTALQRVKAELDQVQEQLRAHDLQCRSWHQSAAERLGGGWRAYLDGLLALLHYTEHSEADIRDALGLLRNTIAVATATSKTSSAEVAQIVIEANHVHALLERIYQQSSSVVLDEKLAERLESPAGWSAMLGEFSLIGASRENINNWLGAIDGWVGQVAAALAAVRSAALEQLLISEALIAKHARATSAPQTAPAPSQAPAAYALLLHGDERERQTRLGWWARFQRADGILPGLARLAVAGGIVAVVLGLGATVSGSATLNVYNGLGRPVVVKIDGIPQTLAPFSATSSAIAAQAGHHIEALTEQGETIEAFDSEKLGSGADGVYNVAAAAPLVEWTAHYGRAVAQPERKLNAPRWLQSHADILFAKAPESISTKGGGGTRSILEGFGGLAPNQQLGLVADDKERQRLIALHARWDLTAQPNTGDWIELATKIDSGAILAERLKQAPDDVTLLRTEQEQEGNERSPAFCARYEERAARQPDNGDLKYIALRCPKDSPESDRAMLAARLRWPGNPWIAYAAAYIKTMGSDPAAAIPDLQLVRAKLPELASQAAVEQARVQRLGGSEVGLDQLAADSSRLQNLLVLERGAGPPDSAQQAYVKLQKGLLALALGNAMGDDWREAQMLRLVAASDGSSADSVQRALALAPERGMDFGTIWVSLALAMKHGADTRPYLDLSRKTFGPYQARIQAFLERVQRDQNPAAAEVLLGRLPLEVKGYAYSAAIVLAGPRAPDAWRQACQRLLFASERPYFAPRTRGVQRS